MASLSFSLSVAMVQTLSNSPATTDSSAADPTQTLQTIMFAFTVLLFDPTSVEFICSEHLEAVSLFRKRVLVD